jgi:hypothetical protein
MEANKITVKTLAISIVVVLAIEIIYRGVLAGQSSSSLSALGWIRSIEALLLVVIAGRYEKDPNAIGLSRLKMLAGFMRGLMWSAWFGIAAGILFMALWAAGIDPLQLVNTPLPSATRQIILFFLVGGVIGPVVEEIFFRGIIFGFFRRWGFYAAILTSTALFALPHYDGNHIPFTQIVGGIVFAAAYEQEKSLVTPITIHGLGNVVMFSLSVFS